MVRIRMLCTLVLASQILEGLLKLPENKECADCKAKGAEVGKNSTAKAHRTALAASIHAYYTRNHFEMGWLKGNEVVAILGAAADLVPMELIASLLGMDDVMAKAGEMKGGQRVGIDEVG
ncbi:hypothetical protein FXO37_04976 [Capsicum annuum]|nr:hypothetical protein FXO37_04976 [Capsicum annuum]